MSTGNTEVVRELATQSYVRRHKAAGKSTFSIPVAEVKKELENRGFPPNHTPQICNALRSRRFLQTNNLELVATDGPPSKTSTTVVFHYRVQPQGDENGNGQAAKAERAPEGLDRMYGFLKDVFAELGGGEKFLCDLRSGDREV
jgi:hypothetical protein